MIKAKTFVNKCKEIQKMKTKYKLGTFMNCTNGKEYLCDCSGLIKAVIWGYPKQGKYQSNGLKDINANSMIKQCKDVSTNFKKIEIGCCVWMDGHIGVYIGNGLVIESTPRWKDGVQITACGNLGEKKGYNSRTWVKHGKMPWVDYTAAKDDFTMPSLKGYKGFSIVDGLKQFGYNSDFSYRNEIWKAMGKSGYKGTAKQNKTMLAYLKMRG